MRVFYAVEIPDKYKEILYNIGLYIKENIGCAKVTEKENMHITVMFIGEIPEKEFGNLNSKFKLKVRTGSFKIKVKDIGAFVTNGIPKVVYADIINGKNELKEINKVLASEYKEVLNKNDLTPRFSPHITLTRVKQENIKEKIDFPKKDIEFEFEVNEINAYESILTPKGPIYKIIDRINLKGEKNNG